MGIGKKGLKGREGLKGQKGRKDGEGEARRRSAEGKTRMRGGWTEGGWAMDRRRSGERMGRTEAYTPRRRTEGEQR